MPHKGQILTDQFTGDFLEFLETGLNSNGQRVRLKVTLISKGQNTGDHIHLLQSETFKVLSGRMIYSIEGEKRVLKAGEEITLPKNIRHNHYNDDDKPAVFIQTISPALDSDYYLENLFGLINDGKVKDGKLSFLQTMVSLNHFESPPLLAAIPRPIQIGLASVLSPVARAMGYRAIYKKYTGMEK